MAKSEKRQLILKTVDEQFAASQARKFKVAAHRMRNKVTLLGKSDLTNHGFGADGNKIV